MDTRCVYGYHQTFTKYDDGHINAFLNEEIVNDFKPTEDSEPTVGYAYTGTGKDGGTILECADASSRDDLINAVIRSKYTQSQEFSILRHHEVDADNYVDEWEEYNSFIEAAKTTVDGWLGKGE